MAITKGHRYPGTPKIVKNTKSINTIHHMYRYSKNIKKSTLLHNENSKMLVRREHKLKNQYAPAPKKKNPPKYHF